MAVAWGPFGTSVTASMVNSITLHNMAQTVSGNFDGSYVFSGYKTVSGCDSSAVYIELTDDVVWNRISCKFIINGTSSCWSFNHTSGWGPGPYDGHLETYSTSLGDVFSEERSINSWGHPQFQSHSRTYACDNDSNNFYHGTYHTGNPKIFLMKRRRLNDGSFGGIYFSTACHGGSGTGQNVTIKNIRIWNE